MLNTITEPPVNTTNGAGPGAPNGNLRNILPLAINRRLPRGRMLPGYGVEYFNQLVAQYLTLPALDRTTANMKAAGVAEDIIREPNNQRLNWGDVSGLEMALLQLLPESYLQRYAWNLRARYHEVAGQDWYDFYRQSAPPDESAPVKEPNQPTVSVANAPPGALSSHILLTPPDSETHPETHPETGAAPLSGDSPAAITLRADLSVLLGDLQRLRSTIQAREEKRSDISRRGAVAAGVSLFMALVVYGITAAYFDGQIVRQPSPVSPPTAVARSAPSRPPAKRGSAVVPKPTPGPHTTAPVTTRTNAGARPAPKTAAKASARPAAETAPHAAPPAAPLSTPADVLQMAALVILGGVLGGLISMLRRLQDLPSGSTPLIDTVALNAGQIGISLAPVYGGIFAMVLYMIFLSGLLSSIIAPAALVVFPRFADATPATTPDIAKLLVWAFIAGFAEKLVPDVLDRLTVKNTAPAQARLMPAPRTRQPTHPA